MKEFNYFAPGSVEEALELMKEYEGKYTILNGGTDVMIRLRERLINPEAVIDIKRIPGLKEITFSKKDGWYAAALPVSAMSSTLLLWRIPSLLSLPATPSWS